METQLFTFTFFIICDCRDPSLFHVEATAMSNYRLRYSAMKSTFKRWARSDIDEPLVERDYFEIFKTGYETYYRVEKMYCTKKGAAERKCIIEENYKIKFCALACWGHR